MDKKEFLEHVGKCINRDALDTYPGYEGIDRSLSDQQKIVSEIRSRLQKNRPQILDKFASGMINVLKMYI